KAVIAATLLPGVIPLTPHRRLISLAMDHSSTTAPGSVGEFLAASLAIGLSLQRLAGARVPNHVHRPVYSVGAVSDLNRRAARRRSARMLPRRRATHGTCACWCRSESS